jgi:hypothetical protein
LIGSDPPAPARSVEIGRLPSPSLSITGHLKSSMERRFQSSVANSDLAADADPTPLGVPPEQIPCSAARAVSLAPTWAFDYSRYATVHPCFTSSSSRQSLQSTRRRCGRIGPHLVSHVAPTAERSDHPRRRPANHTANPCRSTGKSWPLSGASKSYFGAPDLQRIALNHDYVPDCVGQGGGWQQKAQHQQEKTSQWTRPIICGSWSSMSSMASRIIAQTS